MTDFAILTPNEIEAMTGFKIATRPLTDHDRAVLALFRQLPPEKQLSLLTLLRP